MKIIEMEHVSKTFQIYKRPKGIFNNVKALFHRQYEIKKAVDDISFSIEQGELVGYIGANGAGKSTTIKMLSGILVPTSGRILVNGTVPYENRRENAAKIGVVFGQRSQLNWDLPMQDTFELYKKMYKIEEKAYRQNVEMFVELMQMQPFLRTPVRQLSLGQKMRAEISIALLHDPAILYLDEPTIGLDVLAKERIRVFIRELNKEKRITVILTTHDMTDIEEICQRIIFIDQGKVMDDCSLAEFKTKHTEKYNITLNYTGVIAQICDRRVKLERQVDEQTAVYSVSRQEMSVNELLQYFSEHFMIRDIKIASQSIEEIVRELYQKQ